MLKIFRRIRQKYIVEGNLKKYLVYAIGEILLVMIGILLALQVNNWNNIKDENIQAQKVLVALNSEFKQNKTRLIRINSFHQRVYNGCKSLLSFITNIDEIPNENMLDSIFADYSYFMTFDPYNSVLNAAISSGDIHLIKNDSLKILLFAWPAMVSDSNEEEEYARNILFEQKNFYSKFVREKNIWSTRNKSGFKSNYIELLKNPDFENMVHFRSSIVREILSEQTDLLETNDNILKLLKAELR